MSLIETMRPDSSGTMMVGPVFGREGVPPAKDLPWPSLRPAPPLIPPIVCGPPLMMPASGEGVRAAPSPPFGLFGGRISGRVPNVGAVTGLAIATSQDYQLAPAEASVAGARHPHEATARRAVVVRPCRAGLRRGDRLARDGHVPPAIARVRALEVRVLLVLRLQDAAVCVALHGLEVLGQLGAQWCYLRPHLAVDPAEEEVHRVDPVADVRLPLGDHGRHRVGEHAEAVHQHVVVGLVRLRRAAVLRRRVAVDDGLGAVRGVAAHELAAQVLERAHAHDYLVIGPVDAPVLLRVHLDAAAEVPVGEVAHDLRKPGAVQTYLALDAARREEGFENLDLLLRNVRVVVNLRALEVKELRPVAG